MRLGGQFIGGDLRPYVIAELGANHGGNLHTCLAMIDAAKKCGCDAVKLQKRCIDTLYTKEFLDTPYVGHHSYGATYGEHRKALEFSFETYKLIKGYCCENDIALAATAFDEHSVRFLENLGIDWVKVASGDLTNLDLLYKISLMDVPVVMSTGGAEGMTPIREAYEVLTDNGSECAILHCTSGYPTRWNELNLRVIPELSTAFPDTVIGWSSHARGISQATAAYALGARIFESHFTLDRYAKGTDQAFSLEPDGMAAMVRHLGYASQAMGNGIKRRYASEVGPLQKQWKNSEVKVEGKGIG
jgi:sialic acid synthase